MSGHAKGGGRRVRHEEHEEHENHERWLVTYADMVTLLMVLFIVMFAISQVDQRKFAELKDGLAAGFGSQDSILTGAQSLQDQPGEGAVGPVAPELTLSGLDPDQVKLIKQAIDQNDRLERERRSADAANEAERLGKLRDKVVEALEAAGLDGDVRPSYDERGLVLSLVSRHVVFAADLATLTDRGREVVDALSKVLRTIDDPLQIDGHTNQAPVKPKYYATDWDLSAARAVTVLRRLNENAGIPQSRLSLAAFGATKPLLDPALPKSQAINKRVDIVVLSQVPAETRALLPEFGSAADAAARDHGSPLGAGRASAASAARTTSRADETETTTEQDGDHG
ncbi:flagellar motor protein MotB [Nocardioides sp. R-C-SC26]|uniref:OmpA/MotB family protein n=1 Tax=Nocardioides sp. R-C-SC26 TaxID=2870414 RepID=UPI001E553E8B|nr:flagellar motor protein MotB [Nocardioides sp. R-C-SC26]